MPDISMCFGYECKVRDNCYRYKAKPDIPFQSYAYFEDKCNRSNNYKYMIPIKERE